MDLLNLARMGQLAETLVQSLLPARCLLCRESLPRNAYGGVCLSCWQSLPGFSQLPCPLCAEPCPNPPCLACRQDPPPWDRLVVLWSYEGPVRELILAFKNGRDGLAKPMGKGLVRVLDPHRLGSDWCVTFVPMRPFRRWRRGYNQAELLAQELARHSQWPCRSLLMRRAGGSQQGLSRTQRRRQVAGIFRAHAPAPPKVLLVDDVVTTGATGASCTRALKEAGAREVWLLALAKTTMRG